MFLEKQREYQRVLLQKALQKVTAERLAIFFNKPLDYIHSNKVFKVKEIKKIVRLLKSDYLVKLDLLEKRLEKLNVIFDQTSDLLVKRNIQNCVIKIHSLKQRQCNITKDKFILVEHKKNKIKLFWDAEFIQYLHNEMELLECLNQIKRFYKNTENLPLHYFIQMGDKKYRLTTLGKSDNIIFNEYLEKLEQLYDIVD